MIPDFIVNALSDKDIVIYGAAETASSYCYISDTVDALGKLMAGSEPGPVNIGHPEECKISEIAQKIIADLKSSAKIVYEKPLPGLQVQGLPDIKKAKETLGWFPVVTLDQGLRETVSYIESARFHYEEKGLWQSDAPGKD